jgi:hypothetical protein
MEWYSLHLCFNEQVMYARLHNFAPFFFLATQLLGMNFLLPDNLLSKDKKK